MVKPVRCKFCTQMQSLPEDRRQTLYNAIYGVTLVQGKTIETKVIVDILEVWGFDQTTFNVDRHRQRRYSKTCHNLVENRWSAEDG